MLCTDIVSRCLLDMRCKKKKLLGTASKVSMNVLLRQLSRCPVVLSVEKQEDRLGKDAEWEGH